MTRFAGDNPQLANLELALSNSPKDSQDRYNPYAQNTSTVQYGDVQRAPIPSQNPCLLYTSPSPRDVEESRMPSSA